MLVVNVVFFIAPCRFKETCARWH